MNSAYGPARSRAFQIPLSSQPCDQSLNNRGDEEDEYKVRRGMKMQ